MSTDDPKKTEHLISLDGAKERLQLFKANILEEGSFDSVVDGCEGVFHTASPVYSHANDPPRGSSPPPPPPTRFFLINKLHNEGVC